MTHITQTTEEDGAPAVLTVDLVVLHAGHVLLIRRGWPPFAGRMALPGGKIDAGEDIADAAVRELAEETGVVVAAAELAPPKFYAAPGRDPRGRYVSFAHPITLSGARPVATAGDDATEAWWCPIPTALTEIPLAFDHRRILTEAVEAIRRGVELTADRAELTVIRGLRADKGRITVAETGGVVLCWSTGIRGYRLQTRDGEREIGDDHATAAAAFNHAVDQAVTASL